MTEPTLRFIPPPTCGISLAELALRFGGTVETQFPAVSTVYPLPPHASDEVRAFWQAETSAEVPPGVIARIPGGRVFGSGNVLAPDGTAVARDVSFDFGKPPDSHWLFGYDRIPRAQPLAGRTAVVATTLGTGYSHWLLDELPRLLTLPHGAADTVIAHTEAPWPRLALAQWGWTRAVVSPQRTTHVQCEELIVPSHPGTVVHPTRRALDLLAEFATPLQTGASPSGERLYITREHARRRRVTNSAELWTELEPAGFAKVRLEELTWPEQIVAFRHAKVVVAPHGAGLANLAFCLPGTRVIELFNRAYLNGGYWRLAALQGLDYRPIVPVGDEPLGQDRRANRLDITADLAQIRAALV